MEIQGRRGRSYFRVSWFLLCLSLAVFLWGLQGKLALYHAETPSHPRTVAKLIQDGQVNKRTCASDSVRKCDAAQNVERCELVVLKPGMPVRRNRQVRRMVLASIPDAHRRNFFRPPPDVV